MNIPENFFTTEYLFSTAAPTNKTLFLILLGVYVLLIIVAILLSYNKSIHKPLRARFYSLSLTIGIVGVLVSMFRYESIAYIGSRFAMISVLLVAFIWYVSIAIYGVTKMPREMRTQKNHERYLKYLPKKRKK